MQQCCRPKWHVAVTRRCWVLAGCLRGDGLAGPAAATTNKAGLGMLAGASCICSILIALLAFVCISCCFAYCQYGC